MEFSEFVDNFHSSTLALAIYMRIFQVKRIAVPSTLRVRTAAKPVYPKHGLKDKEDCIRTSGHITRRKYRKVASNVLLETRLNVLSSILIIEILG